MSLLKEILFEDDDEDGSWTAFGEITVKVANKQEANRVIAELDKYDGDTPFAWPENPHFNVKTNVLTFSGEVYEEREDYEPDEKDVRDTLNDNFAYFLKDTKLTNVKILKVTAETHNPHSMGRH